MNTSASRLSLPDIARTDATFSVARDFTVERSESQRHAADALLDAWDHIQWPDGLLSVSVYLGDDGATIFHYVQWTDRQAFDSYIASGDPGPAPYIVQNAPGLQMSNVADYTIYRSEQKQTETLPGCIVIVQVEFDGSNADRQRAWIDAVLDALEGDSATGQLPPGGLGAHFHVSLDGTRVLNYAEWESAEAHIAALQRGNQSIGRGPLWDRVQQYPGMIANGFKRFVPYRTRSQS